MDFNRGFYFHFLQVFVPLMVILTIVSVIFYRTETKAITSVVNGDDSSRVQLALKTIKTRLHSLDADIRFLVDQKNFRSWINSGDPKIGRSVRDDMLSFINHYPAYAQLRYLDRTGKEIIRIENQNNNAVILSDDKLQKKSSRYYVESIQKLNNGEIYLSAFDLNVEHGGIEKPYRPMLRIGTPVYDRDDHYRGALILNYPGKPLLDELRSLDMESGRQLWLLNAAGYWLLGPTPDSTWGFMIKSRESQRLQHRYPRIWTQLASATTGTAVAHNNDLFTYASINTANLFPGSNQRIWYLVAFTPHDYLETQYSEIGRQIGLLYGLIALLIAALSWLLARKEMARQYSDNLLREQEKQYRELLEGAPDAIVIVNQDGEIHMLNSEAERIFGYQREELQGKKVEQLLPQRFREHHLQYRQSYTAKPSIRPMGESQDLFALCKDGSELPVEISLSPLQRGNHKLVTAVIRDVTARKERDQHIRDLNLSLIARTTELEAINSELEAFSYSVSHDLRSPLRAVDGFSQTLLKDYGDQLDERGLDRLQRVRAAAQRMGLLIDDLLTLSRITRSDVHKETVDISSTVEKIAADLQQSEPERQVEILVQASLSAHADPRLISVALTNLLSNAWKFTSRTDQPRIEIRGYDGDGEYIYIVEDNGAGFNMEYADKLFGAFQRLHDAREFPGTGIGLATVQRVVHKHGGRVWAEAEEDRGARFYFTLNSKG